MNVSGGLLPGQAVIIGTRKGVFYLQPSSQGSGWALLEPDFLGHIANHVVLDPRDGRTLVAALKTGHLGPTIFRSSDAGRNWQEATRPPAFDKAPEGQPGRVLSHTFWLTPGHALRGGGWFAGSSPQALWRSVDGGDTWSSVRGFNDHPDYAARVEDPQGGTPDGPVLHSIRVDPRDPSHLYLGLSGGGVYESVDEGENWTALNDGLSTAFAEPGEPTWEPAGPSHDPHCVQVHPRNPDILYQQNHCGIYRLERPARVWQRIGRAMPADQGDVGFVIGLHPSRTDTCWVIPMDGTDVWPRTSPGGRPAVYVSRDSGATWQRQERGLPARAWHTVKRQAFAVVGRETAALCFGTTSGEVWWSGDEGDNWACIAAHLPEIYSIDVATVA